MGYVPIPIEVSLESLSITLENTKNAVTNKTKGILLSYYFGARYDPTEIYEYCREQNILIFEDEAESFDSVKRNGHKLAEVSMFSFGMIKPLSALGGSIVVIREK